jgi:transcriptional regulator with XRE-family HTH domain
LARGIQDARYKTLIEALALARRTAGISQTDLAARLGKRQQFVSKYESGERRLDAVELVDICRALNLEVESLLREVATRH